jgi:hypothetical protein
VRALRVLPQRPREPVHSAPPTPPTRSPFRRNTPTRRRLP